MPKTPGLHGIGAELVGFVSGPDDDDANQLLPSLLRDEKR